MRTSSVTVVKEYFKNFIYNLASIGPAKRLFQARITVPPYSLISDAFPEGIRLHLGCGNVDIQGWINVDARPLSHVHSVDLDLQLNSFVDSSVAAIYMCHVLEHFSQADAELMLRRLRCKLAPKGKLLLSVPDFSIICTDYLDHRDISKASKPLLGGQEYAYNFHKSIYDYNGLSVMLRLAGFGSVDSWDPVATFGPRHSDYSVHPVSLNIIATA